MVKMLILCQHSLIFSSNASLSVRRKEKGGRPSSF